MLVEFGIFGFLTFFISMGTSFTAFCKEKKFNKWFGSFSVLVILLLGFYEMILIKPFFIGLSFMFLAAGYNLNPKNISFTKMKQSARYR